MSMNFLTKWFVFVCIILLSFSSVAEEAETVTEQKTSSNYIPEMSEFTRSGGTNTGGGRGCASGNFCTAGTQGPGGTYTSTFDLEDSMTLDQINRGFDMDYGVDVESHPSNSVLPSCVDGNVMQTSDCRDIFNLTVTLLDANNVVHKFEHEVELDFAGERSFAFSQTIPENNFTGLKGEFELFGIDAGFSSGFFGPRFDNPFLTTTFDLVTLLETEVLNIIDSQEQVEIEDAQDINIEIEPTEPEEIEVATEIVVEEIEAAVSEEVEVATEVVVQEIEAAVSEEVEVATEVIIEETEAVELEVEAQQPVEPEIINTINLQEQAESVNVQDTSVEIETTAPEEIDVTTEVVVEEIETVELEIEVQQPVEPEAAQEEMEVSAEVEEEIQEAEVAEPEPATETASTDEPEEQQEEQSEPAQKKVVAQKVKEKVAKKIMGKMNDKSKYDSTNQVRTLAVMGVLGNSRSFFSAQATLQDTPGFFSGATIPDGSIPTNNTAQYLMFGGSNQAHSQMVEDQWQR